MNLPMIVETYLDAYNGRDVEGLYECLAEEIVFENVSNHGLSVRTNGRVAFLELARRSAAMFKDREINVLGAVNAGESVALDIEWAGTPAVDLGAMKADLKVRRLGASFMTIQQGKLVRILEIS